MNCKDITNDSVGAWIEKEGGDVEMAASNIALIACELAGKTYSNGIPPTSIMYVKRGIRAFYYRVTGTRFHLTLNEKWQQDPEPQGSI